MRPLCQQPLIVRPVWGGDFLARRWGKGEAPVGESWEVWRENRTLDGRRFGDVADFPLLIKLLDVKDRLSVQVHPNDAAARLLEGLPHGKSEGWVVLHAAPGAQVACGLVRELSEEELRARALTGDIEEDLAWRAVRAGDVIDVPAGTIHAIDGGVILYEVQQPCDVTYRLYDWGRPRPIHVDKAVAVARRSPARPVPPPTAGRCGAEQLLATEHFVVDRVVAGPREVTDGWEAFTVVEGHLRIAGVSLDAGATVVVPPGPFAIEGDGVALAARAPSTAPPLRA